MRQQDTIMQEHTANAAPKHKPERLKANIATGTMTGEKATRTAALWTTNCT
jgi:hypothetical protein